MVQLSVPSHGERLLGVFYLAAGAGPHPTAIVMHGFPGYEQNLDIAQTLRRRFSEIGGATASIQTSGFDNQKQIQVQLSGPDIATLGRLADQALTLVRQVPGAVDLRIQQTFDYPQINVHVDRSRAAQLGMTQTDVATNMLISLSGSFQTAPSFWTDPKTGVQYNVAVQSPQYRLNSLQSLGNTPVSSSSSGAQQTLSNIATFSRSVGPEVVTHYNARPTVDIYGAVQDTDLGSVTSAFKKIIADAEKDLPKGSKVILRGQAETMTSSFSGLFLGLLGAVVLIYLLIVVNFQSWLDPMIIISALPAALSGIVWMLFLTHTTINVPALTGAIMCMGVATANSILVVSFARERLAAGLSAMDAALEAGFTRFRPVLMTALAMIIGMVPMALGLGKGGEQNAPLGRAVIGGLLFATIATLFFVPVIFSMVHGRRAGATR